MSGKASLLSGLAVGAALAMAAAVPASAAVNVIPTHWSVVSTDGVAGVLRAGSGWGPGSTASSITAPVDGVVPAESTQWNNSSFWWDQDSSVNSSPLHYTITLDHNYTFDRFVVQADNNDTYLIQAWVGGSWQNVWNIPTACCWGLTTRDSGAIAPVTTNMLRFMATGGDNYYAVSEIQGFANVPEPASWALMIAGFGLLGASLRTRRAVTA